MEQTNKSFLSSQAISNYKQIFKKEFGIELTDTEAQIQGVKLLRLFKLIYKPVPKVWLSEKSKRRERREK